ncbi:MAG: ADP-ribosylglycohydrolase family protein, partial [Myxococcota bacterium]
EGWVAEEAFAIAVFCARQSTTFAEAVRLAANHSGDSDSTGSLAGQLVGAAQGVDAIDRRWMDPLDVIDALDRIASRFVDLET